MNQTIEYYFKTMETSNWIATHPTLYIITKTITQSTAATIKTATQTVAQTTTQTTSQTATKTTA